MEKGLKIDKNKTIGQRAIAYLSIMLSSLRVNPDTTEYVGAGRAQTDHADDSSRRFGRIKVGGPKLTTIVESRTGNERNTRRTEN